MNTPRQERHKPKKSKVVNVSSNIKKASKAEKGGTKKIKSMFHWLYYSLVTTSKLKMHQEKQQIFAIT